MIEILIEVLRDNPLLLLFLVAGIGYPLGRLKLGEASLGVAAVLFVGLAFGSLHPDLKVPEVVQQLGLALFVYAIGLSAGPGFFHSLRGAGLRYNLFAVGVIAVTALLTLIPHQLLGLSPGQTAGLFSGILTSTPAMAGVVEYLKHAGASPGALTEPVVGYSIAYPASVLGVITMIYLAQRLWRIDYAAEARGLKGSYGIAEPLQSVTIRVDPTSEAIGRTIPSLVYRFQWKVIFGRVKRNGHADVAGHSTRLEAGDLVTAVGTEEELAGVISTLGHLSHHPADLDRSEVDTRRIFVSSPDVAGKPLKDLHLTRRFGAVVTRVRRGDVELLPHADLVLELGDRVRVLARREGLTEVSRFLGDSYRALSEVDITSLGFGLALGMLLGMVPIPLPGGLTIKLGLAGGPLILSLILGARSRTGPIVWALPYSANLLFRQFGLILFLAGVGTRSGYAFGQTVASGSGMAMLLAATLVVCAASMFALYLGHKWLKLPMGVLVGVIAAIQTQAATLGFVQEQTGNELPNVAYATVYPVAMVIKIVLAQILLSVLL